MTGGWRVVKVLHDQCAGYYHDPGTSFSMSSEKERKLHPFWCSVAYTALLWLLLEPKLYSFSPQFFRDKV